jgi:serine protease Do
MRFPAVALPLLVWVASAGPLRAQPPGFVDDDAITETFTAKLSVLAKDKKGISVKELRERAEKDRAGVLKLDAGGARKRLFPDEVYRKALPGVFLFGSVIENKEAKGGYDTGRLATAWVLDSDGVLVTNWHVFDKIQDGEFYGVMGHDGKTYPVKDILALNKNADIAVVKVAANGLSPLPVAWNGPSVGAWVGVLGHPGDRHFTFTQGSVSRFNKYNDPETKTSSKWMAITAEYAYGSSGSPVLDETGAVVGMAALTENIDYPDDEEPAKNVSRRRMVRLPGQKPKDDKPKADPPKKDDKPAPKGSSLQMVVKLAVPTSELKAVIHKE